MNMSASSSGFYFVFVGVSHFDLSIIAVVKITLRFGWQLKKMNKHESIEHIYENRYNWG